MRGGTLVGLRGEDEACDVGGPGQMLQLLEVHDLQRGWGRSSNNNSSSRSSSSSSSSSIIVAIIVTLQHPHRHSHISRDSRAAVHKCQWVD